MGFFRIILAVTVVITHSAPLFGIKLAGGQTAVESFFVISGFYMQMVLTKKYIPAASPTWPTFFAARIGRLMPLYWLVLILSLIASLAGVDSVVAGQHTKGTDYAGLAPLTAGVFAGTQALLLGQDVLMFTAVDPEGSLYFTRAFHNEANPSYRYLLIGQAWTVSLELMFYALAPWIAKSRTRVLIALAAGSIATRLLLALTGMYSDPWSYRFFPSELLFFLAGMLAYRYRRTLLLYAPDWRLCVAGMTLLWVAFPYLAAAIPVGHLVLPWMLSLLFALVLPTVFQATKHSSLDRRLGEFSYPVYLSHLLVLALVSALWPQSPSWLDVGLVLLAGYALVLIDRPLENQRKKFVINRTRAPMTLPPVATRARRQQAPSYVPRRALPKNPPDSLGG